MRHLPALLLLAACTDVPWKPADPDCATFDEMVVTDPDGVSDETDRGRVDRALAHFAGWSDADGVCVDEVRFVADGTCGPEADEGCWDGEGEPILVEEDVGSDTVRALLCEARAEAPDFTADPYEVFDSKAWFTWACSEGPDELRLADVAADACPGLTISRTQARFLLDEIYPRYDRSILSDESVEVTLHRRALVGNYADVGELVESGGWMYGFEGAEPEVESLVRIDPDTLEVVARIGLPARVESARRRLIPTDTTPIVVYAEETTRVFQPDVAMTTFADVAFPALEEGAPVAGMVVGTTAYLGAILAGAPTPTLLTLDLATGASTALDTPDLIEIIALRADGTRLVGVGWTNTEEEGPQSALLEWETSTGAVTLTPFPYQWGTWDAVRAEAGAVGPVHLGDYASVTVFDGAAWHLAADACGDDRIAGLSWPTTFGGEALLWEEPTEDERIEPGPWLTTVSFDAR